MSFLSPPLLSLPFCPPPLSLLPRPQRSRPSSRPTSPTPDNRHPKIFPFSARTIALLEQADPDLDTAYDKRFKSTGDLWARMEQLERLVEKLVLEKEDAFQMVDSTADEHRSTDGQRVTKLHELIGEVEKVRAEQARTKGQMQEWMEHEQHFRGMIASLSQHIDLQRASIDRFLPIVTPPTGSVTIVFSEIAGRKDLWSDLENAEAVRKAAELHNQLLRYQAKQYHGYEVKCQKDAFIFAFQDPESAAKWTMAVQSNLLYEAWPEAILSHPKAKEEGKTTVLFRGLRVKMGIHCCSPKLVQNGRVVAAHEVDPEVHVDYVGKGVLRAARIQAAAAGGQVLVSNAAWNMLATMNNGRTDFDFGRGVILGEFRLKDVVEPEVLYSLCTVDLQHRQDYFPVPDCDLPPSDLVVDSVGLVTELATSLRTQMQRILAQHETATASAAALAVRLKMTMGDFTQDPRAALKNAVGETEQLGDIIRKTQVALTRHEDFSRQVDQRVRRVEQHIGQLMPVLDELPVLRMQLAAGRKERVSDVGETRAEKMRYLSELESLREMVLSYEQQVKDGKNILQQVKVWYRKNELGVQ